MKIKIKGKYSRDDRRNIVSFIGDINDAKRIKEISVNQDCLNDYFYTVDIIYKDGCTDHYSTQHKTSSSNKKPCVSENVSSYYPIHTSAQIDMRNARLRRYAERR